MSEQSKALTYTSYLALDEILGAQRPRSDEHDEMLFIVVHQVYELWFKELLHELAHLQRLLEEGRGPQALGTFKRILTILKLVVAQLDVIETLQPTQFLSFRDRLESASGFQSAQFRELEAVLGRREHSVLRRTTRRATTTGGSSPPSSGRHSTTPSSPTSPGAATTSPPTGSSAT